MTYQQAIELLYSQLPMFSRMGSAAFKKDLTNIRLLCDHLGHPQNSFKTIHIGGTNGKGSVSHMMAAVLQQSGYKTGLYTSPHLYDFRERIKVNGKMAEEAFVVEFVEKTSKLMEEIEPSFFEITVAMAFQYFRMQEVDVAVIEVGLGGRLDSTNIIEPEISVITNIGWDHMNMLGDTLPQIAGEKAGIIKPGVPVVIGEGLDETLPVFRETALQKGAPLYFTPDHYTAEAYRWEDEFLVAEIHNEKENTTRSFRLDLPGIYQTKNICTALTAMDILESQLAFRLPQDKKEEALSQVKRLTGLHGRWEVLERNPLVILEVAHNKDGLTQMFRHLEQLSYGKLHFVLGMVKDKDVDEALKLFPADATYYFTQAQIPRALEAASLKEKAAAFSLKGEVYPDVNEALSEARQKASASDMIIVCGSIFLVAEVHRQDATAQG
jgi:dihydrofolate synthase/folylpolyglutamate synthase